MNVMKIAHTATGKAVACMREATVKAVRAKMATVKAPSH
jgi:hypothetical protein